MDENEKTCRDIDECTAYRDYEYEDTAPRSQCSHLCVNTVGSWNCQCPDNYHLEQDKRSCAKDFCQHLGNSDPNKAKCSHECVDGPDGYQCKCPQGQTLAADAKTCVSEQAEFNACDDELDQCSPGECVNGAGGTYTCNCPKGYAEKAGRCLDVDECELGIDECTHDCFNIDGAYTCGCPAGFQIGPNQHTCEDIDECLQQPDLCDELFCLNTNGSFSCVCPKGQILSADGHTCKSVDVSECANDNGGCSDICSVVDGGASIVCECPSGTGLLPDGKTCVAASLCHQNNGGCEQICNTDRNQCECYAGYKTDVNGNGKTCVDVNECLENNGGCEQSCLNGDGGFECTCNPGYTMNDDDDDEICMTILL